MESGWLSVWGQEEAERSIQAMLDGELVAPPPKARGPMLSHWSSGLSSRGGFQEFLSPAADRRSLEIKSVGELGCYISPDPYSDVSGVYIAANTTVFLNGDWQYPMTPAEIAGKWWIRCQDAGYSSRQVVLEIISRYGEPTT